MKKKNKIILGSITMVIALAVITTGVLALFTARTDTKMSAVAGTVNVSVGNIDLTNSTNVSPGDNDPNNPVGAPAGTPHELTYTVNNLGSKSIKTRDTIILSVNNSEGMVDARYLALYNNSNELADKSFIYTDNTESVSLNTSKVVKAVKYVFISDNFDGKGISMSANGNAEKENVVDIVKQNASGDVTKSYAYTFALLRDADNEYQHASININVVVEAIQYRNSVDTDWNDVASVTKTYSDANISINVTPDDNETADGTVFK